MKILVFSDSHQRNSYMKTAIDTHIKMGGIDCIFHLGDGVADLECLSPQIPVCYVDGNFEEYITNYIKRKELRTEACIEFGGFKFFLTHGHRYGVKSSLENAIYSAKQKGADVLIFGHTHEKFLKYLPAENDEDKPIHVFNPGSISRPRDNAFSYGVIEIRDNNILFSHGTVI